VLLDTGQERCHFETFAVILSEAKDLHVCRFGNASATAYGSAEDHSEPLFGTVKTVP